MMIKLKLNKKPTEALVADAMHAARFALVAFQHAADHHRDLTRREARRRHSFSAMFTRAGGTLVHQVLVHVDSCQTTARTATRSGRFRLR